MTVLPAVCTALAAMGWSYCAGINVAHGYRRYAALNVATALTALTLMAATIVWMVKT